MKLLSLLLLLTFCSLTAGAQINEPGANRALFTPEIAFGLSASGNSDSYYSGMHGIGSYRFNSYLMAGAGAGVMVEFFETYQTFYMPVFADARLSLPTGRNTNPFIATSAGYDLGFDDPGGLMVNPYLGIMHQTTPRMGWIISLGYRTRSSSLYNETFSFYQLKVAVAL